MATDEEALKAREQIIETAAYLYDRGLLVRTWGNISCKLDEDSFLITPSGIRYQDLKPEYIVQVRTSDLSYSGDIKPSSESKVHAAIYKTRRDAEFIVHTHQVYACCAGVLGKRRIRVEVDGERMIFPIAQYAPPGTTKLADNVRSAVRQFPDSRSILMANHGAVCYGANDDEAVIEAEYLEKACYVFLHDICRLDMGHGITEGFSSRIENGSILFSRNDTPERLKKVHREIYSRRKDIKVILHNMSEAVQAVSRSSEVLHPLLDDFAQQVGHEIRIPSKHDLLDSGSPDIVRNVNAVFMKNEGALCLGANVEDASAAALVLDKECLAELTVSRFGEGQYLSKSEAKRLRRGYINSYGKLADSIS